MKKLNTNRIALCFAFDGLVLPAVTKAQEEGVSQWLPFIPKGTFTGRDGRTWNNSQPDKVVAAFTQPLPFDIEHATEMTDANADDKRARGWIEQLENRDGEIWALVEWTSTGAWDIQSKSWRYYSPAFAFDAEGTVHAVSSGGLTNKPNLHVPALNNQQEETPVDIPALIAQALGLDENATVETAVCAISTLKAEHQTALNSQQTPDLTKYVPTETYQVALNRANGAEAKLAELESAEHEALVDDAIKDGKIAPANKAMYVGLCKSEEGRTQFKQFLETATPIVHTERKSPDSKVVDSNQLEPHEIAMCTKLGVTQEAFQAQKAALNFQ